MRTLQKELENSGFTWQRSVFFGHRFKIWVIIPGIQTTSAIKAAKIGYEHLISMASKNLRLRNLRNEVICLAKPFGCFKRHLACGLNICLFSSLFGKLSNLTNIFQMGGSTTNQLFFLWRNLHKLDMMKREFSV